MTRWDDEGRPVEWVTTTEPEWDDDEREIMLALSMLKADECPRGHSLKYMTDKSPSDLLESGAQQDYMLRVSDLWCSACRAEDRHREAHTAFDKGLAGTDLAEAPGRYSVVREVPLPTD